MSKKNRKADRSIIQAPKSPVIKHQETDHEPDKVLESSTPDSYDAHITPAETAARKDHEGISFKHLDLHPDGSESIDESKGFTVDKEGLVDNFAIEPEIYYKVPGDMRENKKEVSESQDKP